MRHPLPIVVGLQLILLAYTLLLTSVEGQVPVVCVGNATLSNSGVCCPVDPVSGLRCGGPHRGMCRPLSVYRHKYPPRAELDDRMHWPIRMFQETCHCELRFFGVACEECNYGWSGPDCRTPKMLVRRDIRSYSAEEKRVLVDLLVRSDSYPSGYMILFERYANQSDPIKDPKWMHASVRYYLVAMHRYASRSTMYSDADFCNLFSTDFNHNTLAFITWHRYFMMIWEKLITRIALEVYGMEDFAFPFWDWIGRDSCEVCSDDLMGGSGKKDRFGHRLSDKSSFYNMTEYCTIPFPKDRDGSCYGCHTAKIFRPLVRKWINHKYPTKDDLDFVLSMTNYFRPDEKIEESKGCKSFHRAVEGFCYKPNETVHHHLYMHNRMHNLVRGSFCCSATAANDPLFALHHSQVDRILERWLQIHKGGPGDLPVESLEFGACRECGLIGFYPPVRHRDVMVASHNLGYQFEHFEFGEDYPDSTLGQET